MPLYAPGALAIPYHLRTAIDNLTYWDNESLLDLDAAKMGFTFGSFNDGPKTALTGNVTLTNGSTALGGAGTSFTTELAVGSIVQLDADAPGSYAQVLSIGDNTHATLTAAYTGAGGTGAGSKRRMNVTMSWGYNPASIASEPTLNLNIESNYSSGGGVDPGRMEVQWNYGHAGGGFSCRPWAFQVFRGSNLVTIDESADNWTHYNGARTLPFMTWTAPTGGGGNGAFNLYGSMVGMTNNVGFLSQMNAAGLAAVEIARVDASNKVQIAYGTTAYFGGLSTATAEIYNGVSYTLRCSDYAVGIGASVDSSKGKLLVTTNTAQPGVRVEGTPGGYAGIDLSTWGGSYSLDIANNKFIRFADTGATLNICLGVSSNDHLFLLPKEGKHLYLNKTTWGGSYTGDTYAGTNLLVTSGVGMWGHAAPGSQPAAPAGTDAQKIADITAILQGMGACA